MPHAPGRLALRTTALTTWLLRALLPVACMYPSDIILQMVCDTHMDAVDVHFLNDRQGDIL